jgi:hypothetical protein
MVIVIVSVVVVVVVVVVAKQVSRPSGNRHQVRECKESNCSQEPGVWCNNSRAVQWSLGTTADCTATLDH